MVHSPWTNSLTVKNFFDFVNFSIAFSDFQTQIGITKKLTNDEIKKLFLAIDANHNGVIDYSGSFEILNIIEILQNLWLSLLNIICSRLKSILEWHLRSLIWYFKK